MEEVNTKEVQDSNPFEVQKYKDVDVPDEPLVAGYNMIDAMINNDEVPEDIRIKHWWIFTKDNVLGFLDNERKESKLLNFDIIKLDSLTTMRRKAYTFDVEVDFQKLRNVFETKLDRSVGSANASTNMNERKSLISQISENRSVTDSDTSMVKDSFIKKLLRRK